MISPCTAYGNNAFTSLALIGLVQPIHGKVSWISLIPSIIKQIVVLCSSEAYIYIAEFL